MARNQKEVFERTEIAAAVDASLDDDDLWNDLVTENAIPPMKVKGHFIPQPTKEQVDIWRTASDPVVGEKALLGAQYDEVHGLFDHLPQSAWANFNKKYLKHFFNVGDPDDLKG